MQKKLNNYPQSILSYKSKSNPVGPKIVLTCLNHGDEVIGLNTALELLDFLKSNDELFFGELIVFSCLNEAGFWQGSRFFEGQNFDSNVVPNLNRVWPGNQNSYSGLLAKSIFEQIQNLKPDLVLDMHSYAYKSLAHLIVDHPGEDIEKQLIQISKNSQIPFYLEYEPETLEEQALDKSLSNQLCISGIPALTIELGPKGSFSQSQAKIALECLINLLFATQSIKNTNDHSVDKTLPKNMFKAQNTEIEETKNYFRSGIFAGENSFGFFRLLVDIGNFIPEGFLIAQVLDLNGNLVENIVMPKDGYIIAIEDVAVVYPKRQIGVLIGN